MDVTSYFSSFSKKIDGWSDASREIGAVQAMPGLSFFRDKLIQAPENCSLSDIRSWLDAFEGFKEPSVWATHPLTPEERPTAFELIESERPKAYAQFVMDFRYLTFRESELEKTGKIAAYAGWKQDADAPKGSHFFQIRIDCKPPASKAVFMASCWRYLFDQAGIGREFAIETENDSWLAYPLGKLRPRTTEGPFQRKDDPRCTNAWGIEVLGFDDLATARDCLERLADVGQRIREVFTTKIRSSDYSTIHSHYHALRPGWEANISVSFSPQDAEALRNGLEPSVDEMPGASFASEKGNQQSRASLGFRRIAGQWHAVVGAFSGSAEAQQELIGVLNAADYERLI